MDKGFTNMGTWMDNSVKYIHQRLDDQVEEIHVSHEAINAKFEGVDNTLTRADEALGALRGEMRANVLPPRSSLPPTSADNPWKVAFSFTIDEEGNLQSGGYV